MLEEVPERLLEYYFHQRLSGMELDEIKLSLINQMVQEETVEQAIRVIERRELQYRRHQRYLRDARILFWGGIALFLAGASLSGLSYFNAPQHYDIKLFYGLLLGGILCLTIGFVLKRRATP